MTDFVGDPFDPDTMIGRDADLARLVALLEKKAPVIVVSGPAGIGKTTLRNHLAAVLEATDAQLISAIDLEEALQTHARTRRAGAGSDNPLEPGGSTALDAQRGAAVESGGSRRTIVLIDDFRPTPDANGTLVSDLVRRADPEGSMSVVVFTRSDTGLPEGASCVLAPVSRASLLDRFSVVGRLIEPPAEAEEVAVWVDQVEHDLGLAGLLLMALTEVRRDA